MKRGKIFLFITFVFVISVIYISTSITGQITPLDEDPNDQSVLCCVKPNNPRATDSLLNIFHYPSCMNQQPRYLCKNGEHSCVMPYDEVPLFSLPTAYFNWCTDNFGGKMCCGGGSKAYYDEGNRCCSNAILDEGKKGDLATAKTKDIPYKVESQDCCPIETIEGITYNKVKKKRLGGCTACACIQNGNPTGVSCTKSIRGNCDTSGPTNDFLRKYSPVICDNKCSITFICNGVHSHRDSQHYKGCAVDIKCKSKKRYDNVKNSIGWPQCGDDAWNGPCCDKESDHLHCQTCRK